MTRTETQPNVYRYSDDACIFGCIIDARGKTSLWRCWHTFGSDVVTLAEGSSLEQDPDSVAHMALRAGVNKLFETTQHAIDAMQDPISRNDPNTLGSVLATLAFA